MTATSIEPRIGPTALAGPFDDYLCEVHALPKEPNFGIGGDTKMLLLPMVSLATLRYVAPPVEDMRPKTRGIVTEASLRLAHWRWQGGKRTAWYIAEEFQSLYFGGRNFGYRRSLDPFRRVPRKGFDLIRAVDQHGCEGIEWHVDMPHPTNYRRFQTVRLQLALAQLAQGNPGQTRPQ